jgi:crotonobetainyl-CoA:carnitine CoA-transferase CaiB-like acyl-CoA transferase
LLGLAVAPSVPPPSRPVQWFSRHPHPDLPRSRRKQKRPLVVDLSSLWAGPLCSRLLQRCGARVIKVESRQRPDGARRGPPQFFTSMNAGKESLTLDFAKRDDIGRLRDLIAAADIVVEGSRPRALRQLGIDADAMLARNPRLTWISITGYGRADPQGQWIAYGDDAGVAAGLSYLMHQASGHKVIVGDAIADPLTGIHAALAAWSACRRGGGALIALSLVDVVRHCIRFDLPDSHEALCERARRWQAIADAQASRGFLTLA